MWYILLGFQIFCKKNSDTHQHQRMIELVYPELQGSVPHEPRNAIL